MMDDASNRYRKQKEIEEYRQKIIEHYNNQRNKASENLKSNLN